MPVKWRDHRPAQNRQDFIDLKNYRKQIPSIKNEFKSISSVLFSEFTWIDRKNRKINNLMDERFGFNEQPHRKGRGIRPSSAAGGLKIKIISVCCKDSGAPKIFF